MTFALIFDMDGVLIDSTKTNWEVHSKLLKEAGGNLDQEDIAFGLGRALKDIIPYWNNKYNLNLEINDYRNKANEMQFKLLADTKADEHLINLLKNLKQNNIPMEVATSSARHRTEIFLNIIKIKEYFDQIITSEDVSKHKPDHEVFLKAAEKLNIKPENCIVIEDAETGIQAAKNAGMKVIGYTYPQYSKEQIKTAHKVINSFSELSHEEFLKLLN